MEPYLDIRTLALVQFAIYFTLSICMCHYLYSRKTYSGFTTWVAGTTGLAVGTMLIGLSGVISDIFTIIVSNGVGAISLFLIYYGFKAFAKEKVIFRLHIAIILIYSLLIFPLVIYTFDNLNIGISLVSFFSGIYLILCATTLVQTARRKQIQLNQFLLITLVLLIVARLLRGIFFLYTSQNVNEYMGAGPFLGIMNLLTGILSVAMVIGMMQMNAQKLEEEHLVAIDTLRTALDEVKTLRGIIPICSYCKKIRDDKGAWDIIEAYICDHSDAQFSHGICPDCYNKAIG